MIDAFVDAADLAELDEPAQARVVARDGVVVEMPLEHLLHPRAANWSFKHPGTSRRKASPSNKASREMQVKKRIIPLLAAAMIAPTSATATDASAQWQAAPATEPLPAGGPPAPGSPPTYPRLGIPDSPIPSCCSQKPPDGSSKPATTPNTGAPPLPPVQASE